METRREFACRQDAELVKEEIPAMAVTGAESAEDKVINGITAVL